MRKKIVAGNWKMNLNKEEAYLLFNNLESKIVDMIGSEGTFANDVARDLEITSLTLKGLVRRSVKFDFKGHNIVPIKEEE